MTPAFASDELRLINDVGTFLINTLIFKIL
jgi:hypothetical protein